MNPLTVNPVIALDYARQTTAERIRLAEEHRRAALLGKQAASAPSTAWPPVPGAAGSPSPPDPRPGADCAMMGP